MRPAGAVPRVLLDVTRPLTDAPWPGDVPFECGWTMRRAAGDSVDVGWIRSSVHNGTHVDAPLHVLDGGASVDRLPLEAFDGPCRVVTVPALGPIGPRHVGPLAAGERLLLRTGARPTSAFPDEFAWPDEDLVRALAAADAPLLGTDAPSMDAKTSKDLASHRALARAGIQMLENLDLARVVDGRYHLTAFPLKAVGLDGAPVRAVLRA